MSRRWLMAVLVVLVGLAGGAVAGWAVVGGDDHDYEYALERYANETGEANVYVNLPDGDAQLALGSPDGHRIVVQWRDPDGHGWTAPETVWQERGYRAVENTVRYGGGTAAIVETYSKNLNEDSDINNRYVAIVCRDGACDAQVAHTTEAEVTPDGAQAYLGQSESGVLLWDSTEGFREVPWGGHPGFDSRRISASQPVLAPDGSLRLVSSTPARGACTFELFTSPPGSADLTSQARGTQPLQGRGRSDCRTYLRTWSDTWLAVHSSDLEFADFWFVREDGVWRATDQDASGLALIDVDRGCCDTYEAGFIHWNSVAFGSPDGERIQVQSHLLGEEQWSEPVVLDAAPAGSRCTGMDGYEVGPQGYAVVMTCRDGYAVAASPDLRHWDATYLSGARGDPAPDEEGLHIGDRLVWTPQGGF